MLGLGDEWQAFMRYKEIRGQAAAHGYTFRYMSMAPSLS
jgi:hypothetical protein